MLPQIPALRLSRNRCLNQPFPSYNSISQRKYISKEKKQEYKRQIQEQYSLWLNLSGPRFQSWSNTYVSVLFTTILAWNDKRYSCPYASF